jgi:NADP-dependent 3-hydroxy acid dehydrogenase YdfG
MRSSDGKVAVVAEAASGIGKTPAERFARAGIKVVLADIEARPLEATVQAFRQEVQYEQF